MKATTVVAFLSLVLVAATAQFGGRANALSTPSDARLSASAADPSAIAKQYVFRAAMRRLWEDHIVWTRMVIVGVFADAPDTPAALERLLRNQSDIGDAIRPFYGDEAATRLASLLTDHILIAGRLLTAAKAGDTTAFVAAKEDWYENAHDIALFLASANRKWTLAELDEAMRTHLDTTLDEAVARLTEDWEGDVVAYDRVHEHILHLADLLSEGIIDQFPAHFARR